MPQRARPPKRPYSGYHRTAIPAEDPELTHVGPRTPCGEYFRRFWQPIALSRDLDDGLPVALRVLGEDLVLFRDRADRIGVLHRHCSHRGASLEFGIVAERGIRCCYHGWLYDVDGTILETPGEPAGSRIKDKTVHGAYPAFEYKGLVFAYLGPPDDKPPFPTFDTYEMADNRTLPYSIDHPCNWLQVHENFMDPIHAVFLHTRVAGIQLTEAWGEMPEVDYRPTEDGMIYICARRCGEHVWVRSNHVIFPNFGHTAALWEEGNEAKLFTRASITRWTVPIDDTHCLILGWRHFNSQVDPAGRGDEAAVGKDSVDFIGQTGNRSYRDRQREPGDWDAQVSQRPIAIHGLETLGASDRGVAMLRRLLRRRVRALAEDGRVERVTAADGEARASYTHDTVLPIPPPAEGDDRLLLREVGRRVTDIILEADGRPGPERDEEIRRRLAVLAAQPRSAWADAAAAAVGAVDGTA
jgi:phenylpropionate dioxygenase-like ring-hydroxylating dioxygenase large terminal subunit